MSIKPGTCEGSVFRAEDLRGVGFLYAFTHTKKRRGLARGRFSLYIYMQGEVGLRVSPGVAWSQKRNLPENDSQ